jgi:hypothetical protein
MFLSRRSFLVGVGAVALVPVVGCAAETVVPLSSVEAADLAFVREEEKLARDVYQALAAIGGPTFDNIASSEQTHMDRMKELLDLYGVPDPVAGRGPGEFQNADLKALYDALVSAGKASRNGALAVGLEIEELDIHDLDGVKARSSHDDVRGALDELIRGSRNHLRAFYGQLSAVGGTYQAKHIDQAVFMEIATSAQEKGGNGRFSGR